MTHVTKTLTDREGRKTIRTSMPLGGYALHELRIETSKMYGKAGIETDATVVVLHADGSGFTHAFGLGNAFDGDFRKTFIKEAGKRATEKALLTQHAAALVCLDGILAEARGFYVARQAWRETNTPYALAMERAHRTGPAPEDSEFLSHLPHDA